MANRQTYKKHPASKLEYSVYMRNMISTKIHLKMSEVGSNTKQNLERKILQNTEGKCIPEGYVRPDSINLISYSSGVIRNNKIEFHVIYECLICNPVEGMNVECTTVSITKAGIYGEVKTDKGFIPMVVFIARDFNYDNEYFSEIKEGMNIQVSVIGKRFELNDPYIEVIASLLNKNRGDSFSKPRIRVYNDPIPEAPEANLDVDSEDEEEVKEKPTDDIKEPHLTTDSSVSAEDIKMPDNYYRKPDDKISIPTVEEGEIED